MSRIKVLILLSKLLILMATGCQANTQIVDQKSNQAQGQAELFIMTHDSFSASKDLISAFEQANNVKLTFIKSGDAGAVINRAILTKGNPLADVLYGVDNNFLSRALEEDLFEAYKSPELKNIPEKFLLDPTFKALPVDFGDVCINYDKQFFEAKHLPVPVTLEDLVRPEYAGLLVVENPATSSPGLAFLMTTIAHFGEDGYLDYWEKLAQNEVVVVNDWETAYYTNFSGSSGQGDQPMVVSYGSSPPAEVIFAEQPLEDSITASLVGEEMCYRQVEFVGILKGTEKLEMAQKFIDFMLSDPFQEDMPLQMFVFPVNDKAQLPEEFVKYAQIPEKPVQMDSGLIAENRSKWIDAWTEAVLR